MWHARRRRDDRERPLSRARVSPDAPFASSAGLCASIAWSMSSSAYPAYISDSIDRSSDLTKWYFRQWWRSWPTLPYQTYRHVHRQVYDGKRPSKAKKKLWARNGQHEIPALTCCGVWFYRLKWMRTRSDALLPCRVPNINFTFQSIVTFFLEFFQTD
jgi:hypothetical protein